MSNEFKIDMIKLCHKKVTRFKPIYYGLIFFIKPNFDTQCFRNFLETKQIKRCFLFIFENEIFFSLLKNKF
jgi:hypothetical protein